jgi:hypothetical protein
MILVVKDLPTLNLLPSESNLKPSLALYRMMILPHMGAVSASSRDLNNILMMRPATRRSIAIAASLLLSITIIAQQENDPIRKEVKPYRVLTSGKQVTVKSTRNIKNIMVWTSSGHRIVEQKDLNASTFTFNANMKEKVFFLMIQYEGLKPYTEKIGVK